MKKDIELVLIGDSLINRGDWEKLLNRKHLINLGIDGDSTKGVLNRIQTVLQIEPKIVVLMIGINDLCLSTPLQEVFENYKKIVLKLKEASFKIIINAVFITQMASVNKKVLAFNTLLENFCKEQNLSFLDLNEAFTNEKNLLKEELTTDGLHLGQKAYKVWAYKLDKLLKQLI